MYHRDRKEEMMNILAIDPGSEFSAYALWNGEKLLKYGKEKNLWLRNELRDCAFHNLVDIVAIEKIESYGMAVGATVFDTVFWVGRYVEAFTKAMNACVYGKILLVPRKHVKLHLCNSTKAKDSNIIQALKDRFEPELQPKERPRGVLKGLKKDIWQAMAVAVYAQDCLADGGRDVLLETCGVRD